MIFLLLTMFNLFLQKTKRMIENNRSDSSSVSSQSTKLNSNNDDISYSEIENKDLKELIYDIIKTIKDPEKPATLEDLEVIHEEDIHVAQAVYSSTRLIRVEFTPTVPHCSLATLIGLCIRIKLQRNLTEKYKLDIFVKKGSHSTEEEINKQVNDKERVAAAMENPNLFKIVENCILEND